MVLELSTGHPQRHSVRAWGVGFKGALVGFIIGFGQLGQFHGDPFQTILGLRLHCETNQKTNEALNP